MRDKVNKKIIQEKIFAQLSKVGSVVSATIVGSFVDRDDLSVISDIDTIVIVKKLDESIFNQCVDRISELKGSDLGFPDKKVYINSTFGPLKFDTDHQVVVHLMIYDIEGHRTHVLKSPFTCYDWERSPIRMGRSLQDIYPVLKIQPRDFLLARRGLKNYLDDIDQKVVSYRQYQFDGGKAKEVVAEQQLDARHQGEYAYHIVRNLVSNFGKMVMQENECFSDEELYAFWEKDLPDCADFIPYFKVLRSIKMERGLEFPEDTVSKVRDFVVQFEEQLVRNWEQAPDLDFFRHGKTALNDGSFLGQGRDPALLEIPAPVEYSYAHIYTSPMKRCVMTTKGLTGDQIYQTDERLMEMNYGLAEGLNYGQLSERYPELIKAWAAQKDPKFPEGENTEEVSRRLTDFLAEFTGHHDTGNTIIVTHNHVLRCLLGQLFDIPLSVWYRLVIPHVERISIKLKNGRLYPNLSPELKGIVTDSIIGYVS